MTTELQVYGITDDLNWINTSSVTDTSAHESVSIDSLRLLVASYKAVLLATSLLEIFFF